MNRHKTIRGQREPDRAVEARCLYTLSIGCVFQNEARYLKEWIEFHKMVGVQHFVLVDDRSSDDYLDVLQPYIDLGEVELFRHRCPKSMQERGWPDYQRVIHGALVDHLRGQSRWLALVDTDEFIVPSDGSSVLDFLASCDDLGAVYLRWEPFGTSYVARLADNELLTERLCLKWRFRRGHEMLGKSIVKPHCVLHANIHRCELLPGFQCLDSNPGMENDSAPIKIHHYWSRDEDFLLNRKLPRTSIIKGWQIDHTQLDYYLRLFNDVPDHSMQRYSAELRARVFA